MSKPIDDVRNVLMNEMGLNREMIRQETNSIIYEAVEKQVTRILDMGELEKMVFRAVAKHMTGPYERNPVRLLIENALAVAAREFIKERVTIGPKKTE